MEEFSNLLEEKFNEEEINVSKARKDLFELQKKEEYNVLREISELCGGCRRCGNCCRDFPCQLKDADISRICNYLSISREEFIEKYVSKEKSGTYLKNPCPFLKDNDRCKIYSARPEICRWHPIKIILPFTYQIRISEKCGLGNKIGEKFEQFREKNSLKESKVSEELRKTLTNFSKRKEQIISKNGNEPFLIVSSSTLRSFRNWLKKTTRK